MKKWGRFTQWLRPFQRMDVQTLAAHTTDRLRTLSEQRAAQLEILEDAIAMITENRHTAAERLRGHVNRFRAAFQAGEGPEKTLELAWNVQQTWHKLRTIEDSLLTLCNERDSVVAAVRATKAAASTGDALGFSPPPRTRPAAAAA